LEEMRGYHAVPDAFRHTALAQFAATVPQLMAAEPCLEPVTFANADDTPDNEEFAAQTIFPFCLRRKGARLTTTEATIIYHALNADVSGVLPATLPPMLRLLAGRRCHIGQPVKVRDGAMAEAGALRISAGARFVSDSWHEDGTVAQDRLRAEFDQI